MAQFRILLVEDDENDLLLVKRAFKKHFADAFVHVARNGEEAIEYLTNKGKFEDSQKFPFPDVIITDLKMPKLSGFELLAWIKDHKEFRKVVTIVLSSSKQQTDVVHAHELGVESYMVKPHDFAAYGELVERVKSVCEAHVKPESRS